MSRSKDTDINKLMKGLEKLLSSDIAVSTQEGDEILKLLQKYHVPLNNFGTVNVGCPGIMEPLREKVNIELNWIWFKGRSDKLDKVERYEQLLKALQAIDKNTNKQELVEAFKALNLHSKIIFYNIASLQPEKLKCELISCTVPYITDNLNMTEVPYNKGGATTSQIFNKFIEESPLVKSYTIFKVLAEKLDVNITNSGSSSNSYHDEMSKKIYGAILPILDYCEENGGLRLAGLNELTDGSAADIIESTTTLT